MSDFKLDIDYPYDPPSPETLAEKPNRVPYNQHHIRYKHYGRTMELMIQEVNNYEGEEREIMIEQLANHMKKSYLSWNKDAVEDKKIIKDLKELSKGQVDIDEEMKLADAKSLVGKKKQQSKGQQKGHKKKK